MEPENMAKLFKDTNAADAILPQDKSESFYKRPMTAAYYALHMVGITDEWKPYKKQGKEDTNQTLRQALRWV